jgi:hypothetical protein
MNAWLHAQFLNYKHRTKRHPVQEVQYQDINFKLLLKDCVYTGRVVQVVKNLPNKAIGNEFKAQYILKEKKRNVLFLLKKKKRNVHFIPNFEN